MLRNNAVRREKFFALHRFESLLTRCVRAAPFSSSFWNPAELFGFRKPRKTFHVRRIFSSSQPRVFIRLSVFGAKNFSRKQLSGQKLTPRNCSVFGFGTEPAIVGCERRLRLSSSSMVQRLTSKL